MTERINKMSMEVDYKALVLERYPKASLEVKTSGFMTHSHKEYRVQDGDKYLSTTTALSEEAAWKYAYDGISLNK